MPNVYDVNKPEREMVEIGKMKIGTVFIDDDDSYYMVSDEKCHNDDRYIKCMNLSAGVLCIRLNTVKREVFKGKLIMEC